MNPTKIIIIGSSAGGPRILKTLFTDLPRLNASIVYGMPREALATGAVDKVLKTDEIRDTLIELLGLS